MPADSSPEVGTYAPVPVIGHRASLLAEGTDLHVDHPADRAQEPQAAPSGEIDPCIRSGLPSSISLGISSTISDVSPLSPPD